MTDPKTTAAQRHARTLTAGQRLLIRRLTERAAQWVRDGRRDDLDGLAAILGCILRLVVLGAGAYGVWLLVRRWPGVLWAAVPLWCWAAIRAIPKATQHQGQKADGTDEEAQEEPALAPPTEALQPSPRDVCEAVWRIGTPHAHLAVLAEELGTTTDRVREVLAVQAIPVEAVRMRGRGSSTGVKADHFPAPSAPPGVVVAAGQATNNDNNNVRVEHHAGGAHITVTPARQDTRAA